MSIEDALLALEQAGGGLTIRPTGVEVFVPWSESRKWRIFTVKRRADDTYVTMAIRGIEKALKEEK